MEKSKLTSFLQKNGSGRYINEELLRWVGWACTINRNGGRQISIERRSTIRWQSSWYTVPPLMLKELCRNFKNGARTIKNNGSRKMSVIECKKRQWKSGMGRKFDLENQKFRRKDYDFDFENGNWIEIWRLKKIPIRRPR